MKQMSYRLKENGIREWPTISEAAQVQNQFRDLPGHLLIEATRNHLCRYVSLDGDTAEFYLSKRGDNHKYLGPITEMDIKCLAQVYAEQVWPWKNATPNSCQP